MATVEIVKRIGQARQYNSSLGTEIEPEKLKQIKEQLVAAFGAVTVETI